METANNYTNISTLSINSQEEQNLIDQLISIETQRKLLIVPEAKDFGVMTACFIDGEFTLCAEYDINKELRMKLENA